MKYSVAMLRRQKRKPVNRRLPEFLRSRRGPLALDSSCVYPENADFLFDLDGWNECSCLLRGLMFIWRLFFVLYRKRRFPAAPMPADFTAAHSMDIHESGAGVWLHEAPLYSCASCLVTLRKIFAIFTNFFLPKMHLVDWSAHRVRIVLFLESRCWDLQDAISYEVAMLMPSAVISLILSGNRAIVCQMDESEGSNRALEQAVVAATQFCDVVAGDVLEGVFSLTILSARRQPSKLFMLRDRRYPTPGHTPGYVIFTQLYQRDAPSPTGGPTTSRPLFRYRRGRSNQPSRPTTPAVRVNRSVPRHRPCFSTLASTSGSLPARTASCCTASRHCPRCPAPLLRRRFARTRALRFPGEATHRPAPHCAPRAAAFNLRRRLPRRLQHRRAVNTSPAALLLNAAHERPFQLRLAAAASRNWESEDRLESTISAFRRLFAP